MCILRTRVAVVLLACLATLCLNRPAVHAADGDDLSVEKVLRSIERARDHLLSRQQKDGSWTAEEGDRWQVGVTSLSLLALINAGMGPDDPAIRDGLKYLRTSQSAREVRMTYEISLMIMALAAAKDGNRDTLLIGRLAQLLENGQLTQGENAGSWSYSVKNDLLNLSGDRSNGQYAILGLREAAHAGVPIDRKVWQRAQKHWATSQNNDGGWGYSGIHNQKSTGSMTVAGISTMVICNAMLRQGGEDRNPDGTLNCCTEPDPDNTLERAYAWMEKYYAAGHNPNSTVWVLYYMYGLERAGRLSGKRFLKTGRDWYREGADYLVKQQSPRWGSWQGVGGLESDPIVGTSFALLFLSKGLAPVLINKLKFGPPDPQNPGEIAGHNWNWHPDDVRNLTDNISGLEKWPKLVTWQVVDLAKVLKQGSVQDLLQAPVLFMSGKDAPQIDQAGAALLREYVDQGGFLLACANCDGGFDAGFRELVEQRMYPGGEARLKPLTAEHPIFRSEYPLFDAAAAIDLWGVDVGCRTAIVYSPYDLSCRWDKWSLYDPPERTVETKTEISRAMKIGVNAVAYATGREPPNKLVQHELAAQEGREDQVERGLLQVAKLRHTGGWDTAPRALRNLLMGLNRTIGMTASTKPADLPATDPNLFKYPLVYMHGRNRFTMGTQEVSRLREYLQRGGVLFADSCCGAKAFDTSFRDLVDSLFPEAKLKRIPIEHELFSTGVGFDIRKVKRREPQGNNPNVAINAIAQEVEPLLEGIEVNGRLVVIYSRYDLSCALERQASVACAGYVPEDAARIAMNIVLYAMLQDVRYEKMLQREDAETSGEPTAK